MAEAMVTKGKSKYTRKIDTMHTNYGAAATRAQTNYAKVGFKASRVSAYNSAWADMPTNYNAKVTSASADKWATNWKAAMF
jgi:hypothetical protein